MTQIVALQGFAVGLPLAVLFGSLVVSRLFKLSVIGTLLAASAPLALPFIKLPFVKEITHGHPEYVIGGAWAVMLSAALGWVVVRPIVSGAAKSVGVLRLGYLLVLGGALVVTTLLLVNPQVLVEHAPGWRGSGGFVLLSASLLSMSMSLARVLRAALFFVMWSFVSIVLASEVFLHKLPQEVVREDLKRLEAVVPKEAIERAIERLQVAATSNSSTRKAVVLGGNTALGFPLPRDKTLASRLQALFTSSGLNISVCDASFEGATAYEVAWLAHEKVAPLRPDLVFLVGWASDKQLAGASRVGWDQSSALLADDSADDGVRASLSSSMLLRWATSALEEEDVLKDQPRVAPSEFRLAIADAVRALQAAGTMVVLVAEPTLGTDDYPYREAMVETAVETQSLFLSSERIVGQAPDVTRAFSRGSLLSSSGYDALAEGVVSRLRTVSSEL
jgi:hypothetical protein